MSGAVTLERRYRRLLAWFPAEHRQAYGEEMIGVLLASARPGSTRPSAAETADLIGGGVRSRLRRLRSADGEPGGFWRDALAAGAILAPLLLLAQLLSTYVRYLVVRRADEASPAILHLFLRFTAGVPAHTLIMMAAPATTLLALAVAPALAGRGSPLLRWLAIVPAALYVVGLKAPLSLSLPGVPRWTEIGYAAVFVIEIGAFAASSGPRRGWKILGRPRLLLPG